MNAGPDAYVISSGKVVAMDAQGKIVPAGLRKAFTSENEADVVLSYTQTDVDWGVYDLTTGQRVSAAVSYSATALAQALVNRGLVRGLTVAATGTTNVTDENAVVAAFISEAIGVAAYDVHVWSGLPEEGDQWFMNYSKQAHIQFLTEIQAEVPHMTHDAVQTEVALDVSDLALATSVTSGARPTALTPVNATGIATWTRYSDVIATDTLVAIPLTKQNLAGVTERTAITSSIAGVLVSRKSHYSDIAAEGDWYLDAAFGVLFIHSATWATLVTDDSDPVFTYFYYSASASAASDRYIHFTGSGVPGNYVSYDVHSNFCIMGSANDALGLTNVRSLGRLHALTSEPKDLLELVKTAFDLDEMSATGKMPGSATRGFSDKITLSGENVADQLAVITVRI
jgi:hypothetical protein